MQKSKLKILEGFKVCVLFDLWKLELELENEMECDSSDAHGPWLFSKRRRRRRRGVISLLSCENACRNPIHPIEVLCFPESFLLLLPHHARPEYTRPKQVWRKK